MMQSPNPGSSLQPSASVPPHIAGTEVGKGVGLDSGSADAISVRESEESKILRPITCGNHDNPSWRFSDESALHIACYEGNLQRVKAILSVTPNALSTQAIDGDLPIHRAASSPKEGALEVVRALLDSTPGLAQTRGYDGELPLHVACARSRSFLLVRLLMDRYPEGVHEENARCDLPIHRACMNRGPDRDRILQAVLDALPGASLA